MPSIKSDKQELDTNVYEAAKERLRDIIKSFDKCYVCFSGGKDSLTVLHLMKEVYEEMGINKPVDVVFRDEELIPSVVIDFVQKYRKLPWVNMKYFATQMKSNKSLLGRTEDYIQWDKNREWIRPKPDFAISFEQVSSQYEMDDLMCQGDVGSVALITGQRCDESMYRLKTVMNTISKPYISNSGSPRAKLCKPIYDWKEDDIFKYFYDNKIQYCPIYDMQTFNQQALRVATPLHAEASKHIAKLKTLDPVFYNQLAQIFPEVEVQARYSKDLMGKAEDYDKIIDSYPLGVKGILKYIDENLTGHQAELARRRLRTALHLKRNSMATHPETFGGYPLRSLFILIIRGGFKRQLMPMKPSDKDREYEQKCIDAQKEGESE